MSPKEFIDKKKETMFIPSVNFEGDLMVSENQLITLLENYLLIKSKESDSLPCVRLSCFQEVWQKWCESKNTQEFDEWLHAQMHEA